MEKESKKIKNKDHTPHIEGKFDVFIQGRLSSTNANKLVVLLNIFGFGLFFVLALIWATPVGRLNENTAGVEFFKSVQGPNNIVIILAILGLILTALCILFRNSRRTTYYITNVLSGVITPFYGLLSSVIALTLVVDYQNGFNALNFEEINFFFVDILGVAPFTAFSPFFAIFYIIICLTFLSSALALVWTLLHLCYDQRPQGVKPGKNFFIRLKTVFSSKKNNKEITHE